MSESDILDVMRDAITTMLILGGPVMLISLVVGLVISMIQAITQIQEITLAFIPKILVVFASLLVLLPFMISTMTGFMERMADRIISLQ